MKITVSHLDAVLRILEAGGVLVRQQQRDRDGGRPAAEDRK